MFLQDQIKRLSNKPSNPKGRPIRQSLSPRFKYNHQCNCETNRTV